MRLRCARGEPHPVLDATRSHLCSVWRSCWPVEKPGERQPSTCGAQALLFGLVACLPLYRTGRMSYVDIGWPSGVAIVGVIAVAVLDGETT